MGYGSRLSLQNRSLGGGEIRLVLDLERVVILRQHYTVKKVEEKYS